MFPNLEDVAKPPTYKINGVSLGVPNLPLNNGGFHPRLPGDDYLQTPGSPTSWCWISGLGWRLDFLGICKLFCRA